MKNEFQYWKPPKITDHSYRTGLMLNNSLWTEKKTEFIPQKGKRVNWYICGPTVYDHSHLGHAKTYLCFDTIRKIMTRYFKYDVFQVMNITDIDDKIIKRSQEEGKEFFEFARHWEKDFFEIYELLGIDPPDVVTRITEFVPEVVEYIKKIMENGFGYESNGSVYFDTEAFLKSGKVYPRLKVRKKKEDEKAKKPADEEEEEDFSGDKKNKKDFVLWKKSKEGEPFWESPWGKGRPGWHIECSVMCSSELPTPVDLHTGG